VKGKPEESELAAVLMKEDLTYNDGKRAKALKKSFPKEGTSLDTKLDDGASATIEDQLKTWRTAKAKERGVPPYCVLSNQALRNVAVARPGLDQDLLAIPGIGPTIVKTYGAEILQIVSKNAD
jgi:superfamily II DNA helicase RecQ